MNLRKGQQNEQQKGLCSGGIPQRRKSSRQTGDTESTGEDGSRNKEQTPAAASEAVGL
jgi:hypothetical protein